MGISLNQLRRLVSVVDLSTPSRDPAKNDFTAHLHCDSKRKSNTLFGIQISQGSVATRLWYSEIAVQGHSQKNCREQMWICIQ